MTDVGSDLDKFLLQTTGRCSRFRIGWYLTLHRAQPESQGSDLLENAVVQFSGDTHPLRLLRFDHLFVQRANLGFGPLAFRDIHRSAHQLNDLSRVIQNRMPDDVNMFERSVGQHDPVVVEGVYSFLLRLLKVAFYPSPILGEDLSKKCFLGRCAFLRIESKDSEHLLGPVGPFVTGHIQRPTARVAQPLPFRQISLTSPQCLLCLFACGPRTQGDDAKCHVASQFFKKPSLFRRKSVGLRGINAKAAEGVGVFVLEGQGDAGTKTALPKALPPGGESKILCEILNAAAFPAPDGRSGEAAPTFRVGPGYAGGCEISLLGPCPRDWAHAFGLVVFGIAHPRHAVTRLLADDPANFFEQALLIGSAQKDLVAVADRSQFTIQTTQCFLGMLALGDVAYQCQTAAVLSIPWNR